jgi:formiminoglutamase
MTEQVSEFVWQGRVDDEEPQHLASRVHQLVSTLNASDESQRDGLAIVGFCSDEGVRRNKGRVGAKKSPDLLRQALANIPWSMDRPVYDAGNIVCEGLDLEQAHIELAGSVSRLLDIGHFPFVLGGGHEVAYGSWLGLFNHLQSDHKKTQTSQALQIGIVNFDAHFDLRKDTKGASSGTPFYQIAKHCQANNSAFKYCCLGVSEMANTQALFERADELGVSYRRDSQMEMSHFEAAKAQLEAFIEDCDVIYLTIDLDVFPASVAPGVSAPAAKGVSLDVIEPLIGIIKRSGKLKLADIAEYNPDHDIDQWTARIAARLFHSIVK